MSGAIVREAFLRVTQWGLRHRAGQARTASSRAQKTITART